MKNETTEATTFEINLPSNLNTYLTPLLILGAGIMVSSFLWFSSGSSSINTNNSNPDVAGLADFKAGGISGSLETFTEYDNETCEEDGKPVVFMFSATWCPHCQWIGPTFNSWAKEQKDVVVYRYEIDTGDNALTEEIETEVPSEHMDIFNAFNPGGSIPTFVFGCQYARIGNGYEGQDDGLTKELKSYQVILENIL